ncbi:MAG TPA: gluconate 2-dehydrogenase subunit 3 family protein, partial [Saprospiraceae bacterium]|nr:gluconate 2-dehydrogenase subunit 3 family protein [Saprospiraceae bacterium]
MDRREALKYTAYSLGLTLSASTIAAILAGCHLDENTDWVPDFLSTQEVNFLDELAETILPKTKTPGAKDAGVTQFIDLIRPLRFSDEDNTKFKSDLALFMSLAKEETGKDFVKLSTDKKLAWVTAVDKSSYDALNSSKETPSDGRPFYLVLKELILAGYFSSEIVAKHYFEYDP